MTYPVEFRKKVLEIKEAENLSFVEVAKRFHVSKTTVFKWSKTLEPQRTRNKTWKKASKEAIINDVKQFPDSYSRERAARLGLSKSGITYAMKRLGITYKKKP